MSKTAKQETGRSCVLSHRIRDPEFRQLLRIISFHSVSFGCRVEIDTGCIVGLPVVLLNSLERLVIILKANGIRMFERFLECFVDREG